MSDGSELEGLRETIRTLERRLEAVELELGRPGRSPDSVQQHVSPPLPVEMLPSLQEQFDALYPPPLPLPHPRQQEQAAPSQQTEQTQQAEQTLEATIGQNWAGWVGAIVFVLGVLFFLKYAWDQGWINPTPTIRVIAAIMTGVIISGIGERMHWRGLKMLAATLHGTGLSIVLSSFFAAYAWFVPAERVLGVGGAFAGVALTAAIGVLLALHIDSIVLAIIALVGAYLAPIVLNTGQDRSVELLTYMGVLAATGWALGYLRFRWIPVRILVFAATYLMYFGWWGTLGERFSHHHLGTVWLAIFYAGFLMEMIATCCKTEYTPDQAETIDITFAILSLLNTCAAFLTLRIIFPEPTDDLLLGIASVVLALIQGTSAFVTKARAFSICCLVQAAALITLAPPLILDQFSITLAWLALAMVLAVLAWQLNIPAARWWGLVLLVLGIIRLAIFDENLRGVIEFTMGTFSVSRWMLMACGTAILVHVFAWIRPGAPGILPLVEQRFATLFPVMQRDAAAAPSGVLEYATPPVPPKTPEIDTLGIWVAILGTLVFLGATAAEYERSTLTFLWIAWAVPILALVPQGRRIAYVVHAMVVAAVISLKWLFADGLSPIADNWSSLQDAPMMPGFNSVALAGLMLCCLLGTLIRLSTLGHGASSSDRPTLVAWISLILLALFNFEAIRSVDWVVAHGVTLRDPAIVKHVVMSVLWALIGFGAVIVGFRHEIAQLRYAALWLLGVTLLKILAVDMADVKAIWRILSFVAVGGLLLGVSYIYHRQVERHALS